MDTETATTPPAPAGPSTPPVAADPGDEQHRADRLALETIESGIAEIEADLARIDEAGFGAPAAEA